jgi:uncharacterized membrane protein
MNRPLMAASVLSTAIGLALAMQALPSQAQGVTDVTKIDLSKAPQIVKDNVERMKKNNLERCYGINAVSKNDCAEGIHSCAGQATQVRDPKSYVLLPAGDCGKIAGGKLTAS